MAMSRQPLSASRPSTRAVGEGELAGGVRVTCGQLQQRGCGALGGGHEGILGGAAPRQGVQGAAVAGGVTQVGEGLCRVVEEHHAEARDDAVDTRRGKPMPLRVADDERRRQRGRGGARGGAGDRRRGDVHPAAVAAGAEPCGDGQGHRAGATTHIQHLCRRARRDRVGKALAERGEHAVQQGVGLHPGEAGGAVP
jgi:hypothetical protein